MKIDGLLSLQTVYDSAKLGLDYQNGFRQALQQAREKAAESQTMTKVLTESKAAEKVKEDQALREAVQGFEAYFIHQILKQARATIPSGGLLPESNAKGIYEDMLDEARAESMTKVGGFGLTEALMAQLSRK
ncbi:hypothetical protein EII17_00550 [Clostridiales bacterium COT073_COT-073]|nr:hypothetical protein EII17_00550 [Clostridiales bacterium COT073_COT-073]